MDFPSNLVSIIKIKKIEKESFSGPKEYYFKIRVDVKVKKNCDGFSVWQPILRNTDYQKTSNPKFEGGKHLIVEDRKFGNRVAHWHIKRPLPENNYIFSNKVKVQVLPRPLIKISGNLDDYDPNDQDYKKYTVSDTYFDFSFSQLNNLAKKLKGDRKKVEQITKLFYEYVRDNLSYGDPIEGLYSSLDAFKLSKVDCGGYDSLLGALIRSVGIPARLLSGFTTDGKKTRMHAWLEFMTPDGDWIPLDPSIDHLRSQGRVYRAGGFGRVGNDRVLTSIGSNIAVDGKKFSVLQTPLVETKAQDSVTIRKSVVIEAM